MSRKNNAVKVKQNLIIFAMYYLQLYIAKQIMINSKYKFISFLTVLFICFTIVHAKAQTASFYITVPFEEENYFTKTVFPFNPVFIKNNKVKSIVLKDKGEYGINYTYDFNPKGQMVSITNIRYEKESTDTTFYTRYYYNPKGLIDKKARIDYRDGVVRISSYQYDEKNRIDKILIFSLNSKMPNRSQNSDWLAESVPGLDKMVIGGTLPNESLFNEMITQNEFSSWQYCHYIENKFEVEERTEYFDFLKKNDNADTCYQKKTYYYLSGLPVALFLHNGCADKTTPSELYHFNEGFLSTLSDSPNNMEPKNEQYSYNKDKNLVLMEDIWSGQKVSELIMSYNKKGFLKTIQRKSDTAKMSQYFEDRILEVTYRFY